jgi:hypothetical protein
VLRQHNLLVATLLKDTDSGHSAGASPLPPPHTLLPRTYTYENFSESTTAPCTPTQDLQHQWVLSDASKEDAMPMTPPLLVQQLDWVFTPRVMLQDTMPHSDVPNGKNDAPRTPPPPPPAGVSMKAFARTNTTPYTRSQTSNNKPTPCRLRISTTGKMTWCIQQYRHDTAEHNTSHPTQPPKRRRICTVEEKRREASPTHPVPTVRQAEWKGGGAAEAGSLSLADRRAHKKTRA